MRCFARPEAMEGDVEHLTGGGQRCLLTLGGAGGFWLPDWWLGDRSAAFGCSGPFACYALGGCPTFVLGLADRNAVGSLDQVAYLDTRTSLSWCSRESPCSSAW